MIEKSRCTWCIGNPLDEEYHDNEWGVPLHDDQRLFEMLSLEGMQAGLSWNTVLKKRAHYNKVFENFDPKLVSQYKQEKIDELLGDPGIIRNKLKVNSIINNAKLFLKVQEEFGSFDKYIWQFTGYKTLQGKRKLDSEVPATSDESDLMSKDLKKRGFKFVGSTICYAYMQGIGMVNDHTIACYRYSELS
ncbi:DNA-3-methyladenine glycosylase I [Flammeovirga kamogawensis]|uniref:DNA-3-methyladenine glycosylase I n=1 Tax=Flammeovirga kamogawensis TaxID=373891 RepID=A0ABX8GZQ6_9BACT|nr:DNA-3-methyladenine glycosylase I [Flammeovirga kamogawensis]MBB6459267.1 DNA-3-methyladenine glycosylase I [Flammeovirga kamogawensis]QWG08828.1 DNA-3-methyladenine glycosylase I [Flammeovirga kamogawensis]TRX67118.1 DNA-3-methyladenine glycosylase I [Flammeovirga kamogawensis]